jgi:uncharacterized membrane protein
MKRINNFLRQSFIGGILVILPVTVLFIAFRWVFRAVGEFIQPLANPILQRTATPELIVDLIIILLLILTCFLIGTIASTSAGKWLHARFDQTLARLAPGYNLIRDIIHQILGNKSDSPFHKGEVARARIFGPDIATEVTAIVTSRHDNGWFTLFIPTGPNPTSGMIYHLPPEQVELLPYVKVDEALRTIIACGAGSGKLFTPPPP